MAAHAHNHAAPAVARLIDTVLIVGALRVPLNMRGGRPETLMHNGKRFRPLFTNAGVAYYALDAQGA